MNQEHELAELATRLLKPSADNFVERPWGGHWMRRFKQVAGEPKPGAMPWGESFEIAAFDADTEARQYPSRLELAGSVVSLPELLAAEGERFLGRGFVARFGACFPLLPKTLSVKELLSVQGHPAGHTEVYIIIDAEPGATLRLGFNRDIDAAATTASLTRGIESQQRLIELLGAGVDEPALHARVSPWLADRTAPPAGMAGWLAGLVGDRAARDEATDRLCALKALYWDVLDSMNAIEVEPGQVIYNATPRRLVESGVPVSAEVHALGNPEGKEILALEIRRPGPTFRAWDNVRFPKREVDVAGALEALNLSATRADEFVRTRVGVEGRDGVSVSVDSEFFRVEHLVPTAERSISVPASEPHCLHGLSGDVGVVDHNGRPIGRLRQGESALVPIGVGGYRVETDSAAEVVRVSLPEEE